MNTYGPAPPTSECWNGSGFTLPSYRKYSSRPRRGSTVHFTELALPICKPIGMNFVSGLTNLIAKNLQRTLCVGSACLRRQVDKLREDDFPAWKVVYCQQGEQAPRPNGTSNYVGKLDTRMQIGLSVRRYKGPSIQLIMILSPHCRLFHF
jgi:hypothetical protein